MSDKLFSTKIYFNVVLSGQDKFAAETTISADDAKTYQESLGDFLSTMAAKMDDKGDALFVTFEPRAIAGVVPQKPAGTPLPDAPANLPNCPFHGIPIKQKNGRNGPFYSCSERNQSGGYCNWKPAEQK